MKGDRLARSFYTRKNALAVARSLLGKLLVVPDENGERVSGMITETEAYMGPHDRAAHSFGGRRTARNEVMYGAGGRAYVFFVYGMYYQFNVVTGREEEPHAILIRAVEPVEGIDKMRERRPRAKESDLTSGPGKLCIAFGIDRSHNGEDLIDGSRIWIEDHARVPASAVAAGPRVGIDYAKEFTDVPWRFWMRTNPHVSRRK